MQIVIQSLLKAFSRNAHALRYQINNTVQTNTQNEFGDHQLHVDIQCELFINEELRASQQVSHTASEETPQMVPLTEKAPYIVTFDPLDGSSIISSNFTVGTIGAIWQSDEQLLIGKTCRDILSAFCVLYGSRTTVFIYQDNQVQELQLQENNTWVLLKNNIQIKPTTKLFAPGNLRAVINNQYYKQIINNWIESGYTLRYTGGMAPDICQIFSKGEGVFSCFADHKSPSKLRLLYECGPLAFLIEKAGGTSSNGLQSTLDIKITDYQQKTEILVGSKDECSKFLQIWQKQYIEQIQ